MNFDAWDVDIFFDDKMWTGEPATSVRVVEAGPLRATLEVRRQILHSSVVPSSFRSVTTARAWISTPPLIGASDNPAEGCLPGRSFLSAGNVRDTVGQRPAAYASQHQLGLGPLRNLRPKVGGPERRGLRRQPAQRLQVWPRHPEQRHAADLAARAGHSGSGSGLWRTPLHLQPVRACGRLG